MKHILSLFAVLAGGMVVSASADAQYQDSRSPQNQFTPTPTVSPYLDLLRSGEGPGFNFETLVRPRLEQDNRLRNQRIQQQQINRQQQRQVLELQQQQQRQFIQSPFTLALADPVTGAAQSIRPTGQGRPINYTSPITGHRSGRMQLQRSTGRPYFIAITGQGRR